MMKLYGSKPSPYVRRLRMLMAALDYEFILVDVYAPEDREMLVKQNPTLKIPMLDDDGQVMLDSRMIYQYLLEKGHVAGLDLTQQNLLTSIDAANDSFVNLFLLHRSDINTAQDKLYFKLQHERITAVFAHLEQMVQTSAFAQWNFLGMSLFALLDWIIFRSLYDMKTYPNLTAYHQEQAMREECIATDPR